jgi:hypothetical protein
MRALLTRTTSMDLCATQVPYTISPSRLVLYFHGRVCIFSESILSMPRKPSSQQGASPFLAAPAAELYKALIEAIFCPCQGARSATVPITVSSVVYDCHIVSTPLSNHAMRPATNSKELSVGVTRSNVLYDADLYFTCQRLLLHLLLQSKRV